MEGLWAILQPATVGSSRCFSFTFREVGHLYIQRMIWHNLNPQCPIMHFTAVSCLRKSHVILISWRVDQTDRGSAGHLFTPGRLDKWQKHDQDQAQDLDQDQDSARDLDLDQDQGKDALPWNWLHCFTFYWSQWWLTFIIILFLVLCERQQAVFPQYGLPGSQLSHW